MTVFAKKEILRISKNLIKMVQGDAKETGQQRQDVSVLKTR